MARILGGKQGSGAPGWRTRGMSPALGGGRVSADTSSRSGVRRLFARNPAKGAFVNDGTAKDVLGTVVVAKQATLVTALAGTHNDLKYTAKVAGTVGNATRITYVVAGVSTALTVAVAGNDITVNVATNAGSAAISTAAQVLAAVQASVAATAKVSVELATGNDGTGVVTALALTNLAGGTEAVGPHADTPDTTGPQNPRILDGSGGRRRSTPTLQKVVNRATNRRLRRR